MEKRHLDRRLDQMRAEGTRFVTDVNVGGTGEGAVTTEQLREADQAEGEPVGGAT